MQKWADLKTKGCTNPDVLTKSNILGYFGSGKAAMIVDGNWDTATLQKVARQEPRALRAAVRERQPEGRRAVPG